MSDQIAIKVEGVSKTFRLPHEKNSSIKSALINFRGKKKTFEKQKVLDNVSFEVKKGEFFGIVGRNGSGKSTLLKMLAGIYAPSKGSIQVNGKLTPFIELGVGFNPSLTGRENVYLNGALLGFSRKEMAAMYDDIVEFAELEKFMDQKLKNYSSGMQVRLAFSIAIRAKGDILLLDEVLAVGDAAFQQKCYNYFEELKRAKKTVVFVSHDMGAIRRFCSQAVYIETGKLIRKGSSVDIAETYAEKNLAVDKNQISQGLPDKYQIKSKIIDEKQQKVILQTVFQSEDDEELYIGLSILKDGVSIAEISTPLGLKLKNSGKLSYYLNTKIFNAGTYRIDSALFRSSNRELVAVSKHNGQFTVKGFDISKGGALKLEDTWVYEKQ